MSNISKSAFASTPSHRLAAVDLRSIERLQDRMQRWVREQFEELGNLHHNFMIAYATIGTLTVLINLLILFVFLFHKRNALKHHFYLLMLNFVVIDVLRGTCLFLWSLPEFSAKTSSDDMDIVRWEDNTTHGQIPTMINQVALLILRFCNLAIILNLLMITLHEYLYINHPLKYHDVVKPARVIALVGLSWLLSAAFVLLGTFVRHGGPTIQIMHSPKTIHAINTTTTTEMKSNSSEWFNYTYPLRPPNIVRKTNTQHVDPGTIFNFTLVAFCLLCLLAIVLCYLSFFRTVRRIRRTDQRRVSEASALSYDNYCGVEDDNNPRQRGNNRKFLHRHKYIIIIGSVIAVYALYLISYSIMQILHFVLVNQHRATLQQSRSKAIAKWTIQLLFGLHALLQPVCYFRVREFRALVKRAARWFKCCCRNANGERQQEHQPGYTPVRQRFAHIDWHTPKSSRKSDSIIIRSKLPGDANGKMVHV